MYSNNNNAIGCMMYTYVCIHIYMDEILRTFSVTSAKGGGYK